MKKIHTLFQNIFLLLLILFVVDRSLGSLIDYFYERERLGDDSKTTYALTNLKEDILIFGSSRAAHHYVSDVIEDSTGLSCFNVGRDGMKMSYYNIMLKAALSYHTPKMVILDLNHDDFLAEAASEEALAATLLPYIDKNAVIRNFIFEKAPLEAWKSELSMLYRFNSEPVSIVQHHLGIGQKHNGGYEPLKGSKISSSFKMPHRDNRDYKEDPQLVAEFESFVKTVKSKGIDLHVVYSPSLMRVKYNSMATANNVLKRYGLKMLNYSEFYTLSHRSYFYDKTHMNNLGATRFTQVILNRIKEEKLHRKFSKAPKKKPMTSVPVKFEEKYEQNPLNKIVFD